MKLLFILNNMLKEIITRHNCRYGKLIAFILTAVTCLLMVFASISEAQAQPVDIAAADSITKAVADKDINYMVCLAGILSTAFSFYLVKVIIGLNNKQHDVQIEQIKALRDLKEELEDRPHCCHEK